MNPKVLQKCIEELKKEKPNVDYVRGVLETLLEMGDQIVTTRAVVETTKQLPTAKTDIEFKDVATAPQAKDDKPAPHPTHGVLTMETPEERVQRLTRNKVPPAFLGNMSSMQVDPSTKVDGNV